MSQIIPITPLPKPSISNGLPTPNSLPRFPSSIAEISTSNSSNSNLNSNLIATSSNLEQSNSAGANFRRSMSEDTFSHEDELNELDYSLEFDALRDHSGEYNLNYSGGNMSEDSLDMSSLQVPDNGQR